MSAATTKVDTWVSLPRLAVELALSPSTLSRRRSLLRKVPHRGRGSTFQYLRDEALAALAKHLPSMRAAHAEAMTKRRLDPRTSQHLRQVDLRALEDRGAEYLPVVILARLAGCNPRAMHDVVATIRRAAKRGAPGGYRYRADDVVAKLRRLQDRAEEEAEPERAFGLCEPCGVVVGEGGAIGIWIAWRGPRGDRCARVGLFCRRATCCGGEDGEIAELLRVESFKLDATETEIVAAISVPWEPHARAMLHDVVEEIARETKGVIDT